MTTLIWKKTLIAAAVGAASFPGRAAESAPDAATKQMAPIRVEAEDEPEGLKAETQTTSSKMALSVRETPQSVTVITAESLKDRQVTDFGQALEMAAGVTQYSGTGPFGGQAGFGFNETTIRGIPIDSLHDVREDGFINTTYFAMPDMALYDRLEVIKGPNSVVYGRGSAGGLINRIRKKPQAESLAEVELTVGAFDTYRADVDLAGSLTSSGNITGRLVGAYGDEGSFVDGVEMQRTVFAPGVEFQLGDTTRLLLEGLYQHDDFNPAPGMPLIDEGDGHYVAPDVRRSLYFGVPNRKLDDWDIRSGSVQLEQELGDRWLATLRLNKNKSKSPIQLDSYAYGLEDGETQLIRNDFTIDRDVWASELRFSGEMDIAGVPVKIATGAEFSDNDYYRKGAYAYLGYANIYAEDFVSPPAEDAPLEPGAEYTTHDKAQGVYLQAQVKPVERLGILVGLRYDSTDSEYNSISGGFISRNKDHDVTGRIGLTWDFSKSISGYGVYAQSFSPVLFDVGQDQQPLDPETGEIFELGVKTEWFERRLGVNAAIYQIDRDHIPVAALIPPGDPTEPYSVSSGLQRSEGFEIEINGQPLPGWNVSAAYNSVDSKFKDPRDPFFGERPGGSADWQLGLFSTYELQSGPLKGFGFGATVFSIGERGLSPFAHGSLAGYDRVDLNVFYKGLANYDFALSMRNVLDERYVEGADRPGAIAQFGSPPAWLLTVRYRFGD